MIHFDNCTFHDSVNLDEFGEQRVISMQPPEGEVSLCFHQLLSLQHNIHFHLFACSNFSVRLYLSVNTRFTCFISS